VVKEPAPRPQRGALARALVYSKLRFRLSIALRKSSRAESTPRRISRQSSRSLLRRSKPDLGAGRAGDVTASGGTGRGAAATGGDDGGT
jgi:hypothetical protein